jgi:hypothetical protein
VTISEKNYKVNRTGRKNQEAYHCLSKGTKELPTMVIATIKKTHTMTILSVLYYRLITLPRVLTQGLLNDEEFSFDYIIYAMQVGS